MNDVHKEKLLDQRVREAEQYSLDLETPAQKQPPPPDTQVCIGNCKICRFCDGE